MLTIVLVLLILWLCGLSYRVSQLSRLPAPPLAPPVVAALPVPPIPQPPAPPPVSLVAVRYLDAQGQVVGDEQIDRRHRRVARVYGGQRFEASHEEQGVFIYRQANR